MRSPFREEYLYTHTHTHAHSSRHKHWLPGLCHSAAVAAAAPRAPAHPQLFPRLTAIKVVCEFPKTRHLYLLPLTSAASVSSFFYFPLCFLLPFFYSNASQKKKDLQRSSAKLLGTWPSDFSGASSWIWRHGFESAAGPRLPLCFLPVLFVFLFFMVANHLMRLKQRELKKLMRWNGII